MLVDLGFEDVRLEERFDVFTGTRVATNVAPAVAPRGANIVARRA